MEMMSKTVSMSLFRFPLYLLALSLSIFSGVSLLRAADAPPAPAPVSGFAVTTDPVNIAPTPAIRTSPAHVEGAPTNMTQHPNIFCDQADIDHYKEMLKTSKELQMQFAVMKKKMDARIATPVEVPTPQKAADGTYPFIGEGLPDFPSKFPGGPPYTDPQAKFRLWFTTDADDVSDLGFLYAVTGEQKYADYAKKLLLAWARASEWGPMKNVRLRSGQGVWGQIFEEGLIMDHYVRGYDLIYNMPGWTAEERKQIHDELFFPMALVWLYPAAPDKDTDNSGGSFASQVNNRGLITICGIFAMGEVTGDQTLIDAALYGTHTDLKKPDNDQLTTFPPKQSWVVGTKDNPGHGLLNVYFGDGLIPGGMYVEGTPSYAFYALGSMIDCAEIGWRHGIDLYSNNNYAFKYMFDFPILLSYPDFTTPALNDAHRDTILGGPAPAFYEYAYRRYKDPRYLSMINPPEEREFLKAIQDPAMAAKIQEDLLNPPPPPTKAAAPAPSAAPEPGKATESGTATASGTTTAAADEPPPLPKSVRHLTFTQIGSMPPSFMYDLDPNAGETLPASPSVNYPFVGYGILRTPTVDGKGRQSVILSAGPTASHGHPDKLGIDLYALDEPLIPSPGVIFPYNNPMDAKWFHATLAHNTLCVDEQSQEFLASNPRSKARADQLIFAPASTVGMQRAWTDSVYPGVTMDRSIFMTPEYMADIFGAFSGAPHKYDLAWHIKGDVGSDVSLTPVSINQKEIGYNVLTNLRGADVPDKPYTVTLTRGDKVARLHAAAGPATQAIVGDGGIVVDNMATPTHRPPVPTIIQRRDNAASTIFGNVLDFSNAKDGFIKDVAQTGSLDVGYAMLKITTTAGTDFCFTAYRPGSYNAEGLQTDALQAFARMAGADVQTLYLAGGKTLKVGNASINRSVSGLAYVEKTQAGDYIVGNPSPSEATVTVTLPALSGLEPFIVDADGKKGAAPVNVTKNGDTVTLPLPAQGMVGFFKK